MKKPKRIILIFLFVAVLLYISYLVNSILDKKNSEELWNTLRSPSETDCETIGEVDSEGYLFSLENYPPIEKPKKGEFLLVESIRNFDIEGAYDVVDNTGNIIFTVMGTYGRQFVLSPNQKTIAFVGKTMQNCSDYKIGTFDLNTKEVQLVDVDMSPNENEEQESTIALDWSVNGKHLVIGATFTSILDHSSRYNINIYDTETKEIINSLNLNLQEKVTKFPCGAACVTTPLIYDHSKQILSIPTLSDREEPSYKLNVFKIENNKVELTETIPSYQIERPPICASYKYKGGGSGTLCTQYTD